MLLCPTAPTTPPPTVREPVVEPVVSAIDRDDIALTALVVVWSVRTGRALRDVPAQQWSPQELIAFWEDDQLEEDLTSPARPIVSGR